MVTSFSTFRVTGSTPTALADLKVLWLNNLYDQFQDSSATLPIGYQEFSQIYKSWSVTSCTIKWRLRRDTFISTGDQEHSGIYSCIAANDKKGQMGAVDALTYKQARARFYKMNYLPPIGNQYASTTTGEGYGPNMKSSWKSVFVDCRRFINDEDVDKNSTNTDMLTNNCGAFKDDGLPDEGPAKYVGAHMHFFNDEGGVITTGKSCWVDCYIMSNVIFFQPKD